MSTLDRGYVYRCTKCTYRSEKLTTVFHILKVHLELEDVPASCSLCGYRCFSSRQLEAHVRTYRRHSTLRERRRETRPDAVFFTYRPNARGVINGVDMRKVDKDQSRREWQQRSQEARLVRESREALRMARAALEPERDFISGPDHRGRCVTQRDSGARCETPLDSRVRGAISKHVEPSESYETTSDLRDSSLSPIIGSTWDSPLLNVEMGEDPFAFHENIIATAMQQSQIVPCLEETAQSPVDASPTSAMPIHRDVICQTDSTCQKDGSCQTDGPRQYHGSCQTDNSHQTDCLTQTEISAVDSHVTVTTSQTWAPLVDALVANQKLMTEILKELRRKTQHSPRHSSRTVSVDTVSETPRLVEKAPPPATSTTLTKKEEPLLKRMEEEVKETRKGTKKRRIVKTPEFVAVSDSD